MVTYRLDFQYSVWMNRVWYSKVWVKVIWATRSVFWIMQDNRNPDSSNGVNIIRAAEDSCGDCWFHRNQPNDSFVRTTEWLRCVRSAYLWLSGQRTLPSNDNRTFQEGCICPLHIKHGSSEWYDYCRKNGPYNTINNPDRYPAWTIIYNYWDFADIKKPDGTTETKDSYAAL